MTPPTITLEQYRALAADARAAQRMIREAVEPPFVKEAELLVKGILAIAGERE